MTDKDKKALQLVDIVFIGAHVLWVFLYVAARTWAFAITDNSDAGNYVRQVVTLYFVQFNFVVLGWIGLHFYPEHWKWFVAFNTLQFVNGVYNMLEIAVYLDTFSTSPPYVALLDFMLYAVAVYQLVVLFAGLFYHAWCAMATSAKEKKTVKVVEKMTRKDTDDLPLIMPRGNRRETLYEF